MSNRLALETSPYLLQHRDNPVDWYPWGEQALSRARELDRPILLSIGYAACHWCHVMEHESFENVDTAAMMNELFVSIKVDREERPDLDAIYMDAVQRLTGHGGWPMTMFLLPDGRPFYGGTYYPPDDRHGLPGFKRVLRSVADIYRTRRADVEENAQQLTESLAEGLQVAAETALPAAILPRAANAVRTSFDREEGGFGGAPKFPQPMILEFLLRAHLHGDTHALSMVETSLTKMARGGIYDQIGGGFHRYSVDDQWLVPHFEKMLYDNAQLARVYLDGYRSTGNPLFRRIAEETLRYVQREMTSTEGGFYASQDADSEGEEGKFFVWTPQELTDLLGADADVFMQVYDVTAEGNFEGSNILHLEDDPQEVARERALDPEQFQAMLAHGRSVLFEAREQRIKPARDEKIITAWNGLMLRAFANAAAILGDPSFMETAQRNAEYLLSTLCHEGRLLRTARDGKAKLNGYLEDYAFLADGLLALYEAGGGSRWLEEAQKLVEALITHFSDPAGGPFYSTSDDHEQLISRPRDLYDNATPSGNSVAAEVLLRLAVHTGEEHYHLRAIQAMAPLGEAMASHPLAFGRLLCAADFAIDVPRELVIIGEPSSVDTQALLHTATVRFDPNLVTAIATSTEAEQSRGPLLLDRVQRENHATAYLCERYTCQAPVTTPEALKALLA